MRLGPGFVEWVPALAWRSSDRCLFRRALSVAMMRRNHPEICRRCSAPWHDLRVHCGCPNGLANRCLAVRVDGSNCRPMRFSGSGIGCRLRRRVRRASAVVVCWRPGMVCWVRLWSNRFKRGGDGRLSVGSSGGWPIAIALGNCCSRSNSWNLARRPPTRLVISGGDSVSFAGR